MSEAMNAQTPPVISSRGLKKSFWQGGAEVAVLHAVDIDIARGERRAN